jgi:hypothetical protein
MGKEDWTYTPTQNPDYRYRVNSYGQIFELCKPIAIITHKKASWYKAWQFESLDIETRGYKFSCFDKSCVKRLI